MTRKVIRIALLATWCATYLLANAKDVAQPGKEMSKAFVPTGQIPRLSRHPMHQISPSNQFGSDMEGYQHFRARVQKTVQADAKRAQHGVAFVSLMGLMVSVGLVASIGIAAIRAHSVHGEQALRSTVTLQVSLSQARS